MGDKYGKCFGQFGWREFLSNRLNILSEFDIAKERNRNRPVQTSHGDALEAVIRDWMGTFLPKKYAVTQGYIIPNIYDDSDKIYHFDIIIYNQLESPVLWTDGNMDDSALGRSLAIPAKFVCGILEVKSTFNKKSIISGISKLKSINNFKNQLDNNFISGIIFGDLKEDVNKRVKLLDEFLELGGVHNFFGGLVLRYENDELSSGYLTYHPQSEDRIEKKEFEYLVKPIDSLNIYMTEKNNVEISENGAGVRLICTSPNNYSLTKLYTTLTCNQESFVDCVWSNSTFSDFCVDLLACLEGYSFDDERKSTFGRVFDVCEVKKAKLQKSKPNTKKPHLAYMLNNKNCDIVELDKESIKLNFQYSIYNKSLIPVYFSSDKFKNKMLLTGQKIAATQDSYELHSSKGLEYIYNILDNEGYEIPLRAVYYTLDNQKEFIAIENIIVAKRNEINLLIK